MSDYRLSHSGDGIPPCSRRRDLVARFTSVQGTISQLEQYLATGQCHINPSFTLSTCHRCSEKDPRHGRVAMRQELACLNTVLAELRQELASVAQN